MVQLLQITTRTKTDARPEIYHRLQQISHYCPGRKPDGRATPQTSNNQKPSGSSRLQKSTCYRREWSSYSNWANAVQNLKLLFSIKFLYCNKALHMFWGRSGWADTQRGANQAISDGWEGGFDSVIPDGSHLLSNISRSTIRFPSLCGVRLDSPAVVQFISYIREKNLAGEVAVEIAPPVKPKGWKM